MKAFSATMFCFVLTGTALRAESVKPLPIFEKLQSGSRQTVIVYGTSLTADGHWTKAMKSWFDKRYPGQVKFINSGGPGMNSDWGLANLGDKVLKYDPDLVFVEFSYNDAHAKFKLTPEKAAGNLDGIIAGIQKHKPETAIVLQIMNLPWDAPNGKGSKSSRPKLGEFNANYLAAAEDKGIPMVNHLPNWAKLLKEDPDRYHAVVPDGTHPNKEGSLAITWPMLETWLEGSAAVAVTR